MTRFAYLCDERGARVGGGEVHGHDPAFHGAGDAGEAADRATLPRLPAYQRLRLHVGHADFVLVDVDGGEPKEAGAETELE
jgi:hypothetical protein